MVEQRAGGVLPLVRAFPVKGVLTQPLDQPQRPPPHLLQRPEPDTDLGGVSGERLSAKFFPLCSGHDRAEIPVCEGELLAPGMRGRLFYGHVDVRGVEGGGSAASRRSYSKISRGSEEIVMRTRLCELLGIEYPIIQAGMGIVHPAHALVAAVSNAGALGSLGAALRSPSELREQIALIRERTTRPFAVNFVVSDFKEETFAAALDARPAVISLALGDPGDLVRRAHAAGALVVHQIHTVAQAVQAAGRGVDAVIAQGGEAGGFGQFVSTLPLIPQVVDAVRPLPVVAAGGIGDGRGIAAALLLGAAGVNMGTRFLASVEAPIAEGWKKLIIAAQSEDAIKVELWNDISRSPMGRAGYGTVPRALRTPSTISGHSDGQKQFRKSKSCAGRSRQPSRKVDSTSTCPLRDRAPVSSTRYCRCARSSGG